MSSTNMDPKVRQASEKDLKDVAQDPSNEDEETLTPSQSVQAEEEEEAEEEVNAEEEVVDDMEEEEEEKAPSTEAGEPAEEEAGAEEAPEEPVDESKLEPGYSTRGRSTEVAADALERLARDALGDLGREKEITTTAISRESFLSETLTEEERRTRTRYIPEVEGMHMLRKSEIKSDLALARSKSKRKSADDGTDIEGYERSEASEDDHGLKSIPIGTGELALPSAAFIPPVVESPLDSNSPRVIEAVTAFNPPRPPESVGAKKKHRMLRWERRPAEIDVDLSNYRKTVEKTREELQNAESEKQRIEIVDNHLRINYFRHLECMTYELDKLNEEIARVQQECIGAADILTSRTRSRGAGKGSYVMRDVLSVLKSRGAEISARNLQLEGTNDKNQHKGAGGVSAISFQDWNNATEITLTGPAQGWLLPGDKVKTPCGVGNVVTVYPAGSTEGLSESELQVKDDAMDIDPVSSSAIPAKMNGAKSNNLPCPRVRVQFPFGTGFFPLEAVESLEKPSTYSDVMLAKRWKALVDTAMPLGTMLDIAAAAKAQSTEDQGHDSGNKMDVDQVDSASEVSSVNDSKNRLLPFGADLMPTISGRGDQVWKADLVTLDRSLDKHLFREGGVLGAKGNPGVPTSVRKAEDESENYLQLKAEILQLRNKVYRQRRIRLLNERTFAASQDRALRVEALVAEMRSDLKSLKSRLDDEVRELGISEEEAESILSDYYRSLDSSHAGEASPPKRPRRDNGVENVAVVGNSTKQ